MFFYLYIYVFYIKYRNNLYFYREENEFRKLMNVLSGIEYVI